MSQTSYDLEQPIAKVGLLADNGFSDKITGIASEALPFGQFTSRVTGSDTKAQLPAAATDVTDVKKVLGVVISEQSRESKVDGLPPTYSETEAASLLRQGRIYVVAEGPVSPSDEVYVTYEGRSQVQTVAIDTAFVTGNLIDGEIDGVAITQVPFNTSNAQTLTDLAAELQTNPNILTAVSNGTETITVTSIPDAKVVLTNFVTTGGAGQSVFTIVVTVTMFTLLSRGSFRSDADTARAALLENAKFMTTAAAGEFVVVEVKL